MKNSLPLRLGAAGRRHHAAADLAGERIDAFLTSLGKLRYGLRRIEALLLDLKYAEAVDEASAGTAGAAQQLREGWETVEPGMRRVIFDRRDMPQGESLPERLRARVTAICEGYSVCDGGQGCGDGSASSGLTGEPMEGP
ncbi:hypothetical protein [Sphingopyxis sp. H115]|uniref:hypothetical protein n=1 Tax=Sphingopyxis sp. H115 TaxID=1759073 RepID=UPI00073C6BBF|nr:hypothetical protein [Sphingopyxis sp. H115]KTE16982.1 hypothetical protein ATE71_03045 [Sphingopyxis sp. H115]